MTTGILTLAFFTDVSVLNMTATIAWNAVNSYGLVALPLFVLMGEILLRSGISRRMFGALAPFMERLPGGLLHINVIGSAMFAAISGSSAATAATIGKITLPELKSRGYCEKLAVGSLAGAGTLGFLIPPSIIMIVYGVMAGVSVGQLFIAGLLPGLLLVFMFSGWICLQHGLNSSKKMKVKPTTKESFKWNFAARGLLGLAPVVALIVIVLGSIYSGVATTTESAAIGVMGATILGLLTGELSLNELREAASQAVYTSSMIGMILAGAAVLSTAVDLVGLPKALVEAVSARHLEPLATIAALIGLYVLLGMFLDGISMVVVTLPLALPIATTAGYSSLWFGIFLVIMVEMAQITPPVGFNIFVLQGLTGRSAGWIARAALPFFLILLGFALLLAIFPGIATVMVPDI